MKDKRIYDVDEIRCWYEIEYAVQLNLLSLNYKIIDRNYLNSINSKFCDMQNVTD